MKKYPLLTKIFVVLALCIIIPIILVTSLSNYTIMRYSETEISKSGIGKLKVAKSIIDLLVDSISKDSLRLSLSNNLKDLYDIDHLQSALKNPNELWKLSLFQSTISEMVKTNSKYHSVYLYLFNADYVVTSNESVLPREDFKDIDFIKSYTENKQYKAGLSWLTIRTPYPSGNSNSPAQPSDNIISYIFPLTPYTPTMKGVLVVNILEEAMNKLINSNNFDNEGSIFILSNKGEVISHVDKSLVNRNLSDQAYIQQILASGSEEGYTVTNWNGKKYLVSYLKTDLNNWIYVGVFSLDALTGKITSLRMGILYGSILLVLMGIPLSFLLSRRIYSPVRKLIYEIKSRIEIEPTGRESEVTLLSKAFDTLINQENHLFDALERNKRNLRENYLSGLLKGTANVPDTNYEVSVDFAFPYFLCAILSIDGFREFETNFSYEQQYYLKTILLNIAEDVLHSHFQCAGLVMEKDKMVLILNTDSTDPLHMEAVLKEKIPVIQKEAVKVMETTVTLSIGTIYDAPTSIKDSYFEAQNSLKLRFISGHGSILFSRKQPAENIQYFYPFALENHIFNHVIAGSKEAVVCAVSNFIKEIQENKNLNYDSVVLILNQLIGNTIKYLLESSISASKVFGNEFNIYQQLMENETLDEAGLWLSKIFLQIIEYCEKPKVDSKKHIEKIMDYIHNNYKMDIDINALADHVGLSYSHVRKVFFDETGENIVTYINNLRIEEARRLLCQTNMNINDIALYLGYNNNQSFNRFFKKFEGITPGEYRKLKNW